MYSILHYRKEQTSRCVLECPALVPLPCPKDRAVPKITQPMLQQNNCYIWTGPHFIRQCEILETTL